MKTATRDVRRTLNDLMPVLWEDAHYVAVYKPPRIDLESPIARRGPSIIQTLVGTEPGGPGRESVPDNDLLPLILPETFASGLALFARSEEAEHRFAGMALSQRLSFGHTAVVKGNPPRGKMAVKPQQVIKASKPGREPKTPPPPARVQILESSGSLHLVRCSTPASGLDELRRCLKAAGGLTIVGDVPFKPHAPTRRRPTTRLPMVHLEHLQFPHPFLNKPVSIHAATPKSFPSFLTSPQVVEENLRAALAARLALLLDDETDCFRLFAGKNEGIGGLVADRFAHAVVLETRQGKFEGDEKQLRQVANWYKRTLGTKSVYAQLAPRSRDLPEVSRTEGGRAFVDLLKGESADEVVVVENGLRFIIRPSAGLANGLFLDHRDNRRRIARMAEGKDLLNLFAYTCGFGVAAAAGGARTTTNVDLSAANLEWGRRNYEINGLKLDDATFIRGDAFEYFRRAERQNRSFDIVVMDPPTFARSKKPKRVFEIKKHLGDLIEGALRLLNPSGHMLIATNSRQLPLGWLIEQVERASPERSFEIVAKPRLPLDFAPDPSVQKSIIVQFM